MNTYELNVTVKIEATDADDAEELLSELFDTDPAIVGHEFHTVESPVV